MTRSYSASAYYKPNAERPNLSVCTEALVSRIVFDAAGTSENGGIKATGVEFIVGDKTFTVQVNNEVIVSGGSINSPQILELSGIGARDNLEKHGIECLVDNSAVGENLQDHAALPLSYVSIACVTCIILLTREIGS